MYREMIGKRSVKVLNIVEPSTVSKFAHAIGDAHPIYLDPEYAKNSRHRRNIAPATFPRTFDDGKIEGLDLPEKGLIHGTQSFHYERPLYVGESVYCYKEIKNYYEKKGGSGVMGFLVIESNGDDRDGHTIFTSTAIIVISEAVRKGINP